MIKNVGSALVWTLLACVAVYFISMFLGIMNVASNIAVLFGLLGLVATVTLSGGYVVSRINRYQENFWKFFLAVLCLGAVATTNGCARVEPGMVGIVVSYAGSDRGVGDLPIQTGWVFYNPFTQRVLEYPSFMQNAVWTKDTRDGSPMDEEISFNVKGGVVVGSDVALSYQISKDKIPNFYVTFRNDDLHAFSHGYLHNVVRDVFNDLGGEYSAEDILGAKKADFIKRASDEINKRLKDVGVEIKQFGFINAPRPPEQVNKAIIDKIAMTQAAQTRENQLQMTVAQAKMDVAKAEGEAQARLASAQGEAKANAVLAASITPELIAWRGLMLRERAIEKWSGGLPSVDGSGNGMSLLLGVPNK